MGESARILVVDDDENIRKVLMVEKSRTKFYNLALIDIRLPDMEGVELLTKIRDTTPKMRKIIITGYPTLKNAVEAVNKGADAYIMKPFDMKELLSKIKEQLKKQREEKKYSEEKVKEFIETRVRELEKAPQFRKKR